MKTFSTILAILSLAAMAQADPIPKRAFVPPKLGGIPREDALGAIRLERSKALTSDFREKKAAGRLAGVPTWDLSNVNGKNYITSVKDQGSCGACVSFSTTAALESSIYYRSGSPASSAIPTTPDLSEQYLYYCGGARTCDAGWYIDTGAYTAVSSGSYPEQCMPYSTANPVCGTNSCSASANIVKNGTGTLQAVQLNTWEAIRSHIFNYGPISTGFNVYSDFPGFADSTVTTFGSSYVWPGTKTNKLLGGHAVMCYGFDDNMLNGQTATSTGVLFCKNSWNTWWGNKGHFKIAYGADGIMSGYGDTMGFIWMPAAPAPPAPAATTTAPAPPPVVVTTAAPVVPTTAAPVVTQTPLPPPPVVPTTAVPVVTTPAPVRTTSRKVQTTKAPAKPRLKLSAGSCQNSAIVVTCAPYPGTYLNITSVMYGRDAVGTSPSYSGNCLAPNRIYNSNTLCPTDKSANWRVCNGYTTCYGAASDSVMGRSSCATSVWKLARVNYDCLPAESFRAKGNLKVALRGGSKKLTGTK